MRPKNKSCFMGKPQPSLGFGVSGCWGRQSETQCTVLMMLNPRSRHPFLIVSCFQSTNAQTTPTVFLPVRGTAEVTFWLIIIIIIIIVVIIIIIIKVQSVSQREQGSSVGICHQRAQTVTPEESSDGR